MKKILICIPTFNRSHYLGSILSQINSLPYTEHDIKIIVIDDGSDEKNEKNNRIYCNDWDNVNYIRHNKNYGKQKYWKTVNEFTRLIEVMPEQDYYFYLPDDFTLCDDFFNKAIEMWETIHDENKICLSLFTDKERMQNPNWVERLPDLIQFDQHHFYRSQWMDMCIISTRKFYEELDFTIKKVSAKRWADYDAIGSGVGPQITKRLNKNYSLYHVSNSLCFEEEHESKMNPNRVQGYTIQCNRRDPSQKVHIGIASIPSREQMLQRTIESLIYQADKIFVYLNNYQQVPEFLNNPKIEVFRSQDCGGDMGDIGKFYRFGPDIKGYIFSCDDDIIYPGDYIYQMVNHIENNNRKAIIGLHGITLHKKVEDYYRDRDTIPCLRNSISNVFVHILGTGALAYHSSTMQMVIRTKRQQEGFVNMADIHFGIEAQQNKVPMLCVKHSGDWLHYMEPEETIFDEAKNNCEKQTELVNSIPWKINTIEEKYWYHKMTEEVLESRK